MDAFKEFKLPVATADKTASLSFQPWQPQMTQQPSTDDLKQSELLAAALTRAGTKHEFLIIEGAPHTFHLQPKQRDLRPIVLGFFDHHLKHAR